MRSDTAKPRQARHTIRGLNFKKSDHCLHRLNLPPFRCCLFHFKAEVQL
jgi:hypothetical protein